MDTRRATEGPADALDSTSRSPTERNTETCADPPPQWKAREKCGLGFDIGFSKIVTNPKSRSM